MRFALVTISFLSSLLLVLLTADGLEWIGRGQALPTAPLSPPPHTLRSAGQLRGLLMGTAIASEPLKSDRVYAETLASEYNIVTPENALKFEPLRPSPDKFNFVDSEAIVDFAAKHGMAVHGHVLVWHNRVPQWLFNGNFSSIEVAAILKKHIHTLVGRYRRRVQSWDVVNEAVDDNTVQLRDSFWLKTLGPDYIGRAFTWAREADPTAKLFYNDYGGEALGQKSDAIYHLLKTLKDQRVPVDGIGLQAHWVLEHAPPMRDIDANIKRLSALGLELRISELDVRMTMPPTEEKLQKQAAMYRDILHVCLSIFNCKSFATWGFTDKYSWIPAYFPGIGAALPFDESYKPKLAYAALLDELSKNRKPTSRH